MRRYVLGRVLLLLSPNQTTTKYGDLPRAVPLTAILAENVQNTTNNCRFLRLLGGRQEAEQVYCCLANETTPVRRTAG